MIKSVIIDDQQLFRDGFELLLSTLDDFSFEFIQSDMNALIHNEPIEGLELIFIALSEKQLDEISKFRLIRKKYKSAKIAVLSMFDNTKVVRESFQKGIDAYFLKTTDISKINEGLQVIFEGDTFMTEGLRLTPEIGHEPKSEVRQNLYHENFQIKQKLTKRENEVLSLIVMAKSNAEIGESLFISDQTVGVHKKNIMRKLGVHNTVSLIRYAIDNNLA